MNVWLVGSRGMLGRAVEEQLQRREIEYFASNSEINITDIDSVQDFLAGCELDWIINCAAYTAVDKCEDEQEYAYRVNALGPHNLSSIAAQKGASLVQMSTDYVFDGTKQGVYFEDDIPNPLSVYGRTKLQGEKFISNNMKEFIIIRTAWLYGHSGQNFVYTMLKLMNQRQEIQVVNDQYGNPTYAPDLAEAIINMISCYQPVYGIFHFSGSGECTWYDFAREIYRQGRDFGLISNECAIQAVSSTQFLQKAPRPQNSRLSKNKIADSHLVTIPQWDKSLKRFMLQERK